MGSLDDTLRLEATESSPLQGETPFPSAIRPTVSGLQWLAVPSGKAGWAFRIVGGGAVLERLAVSSDGSVSISANVNIHAPATHVCTSVDGRLVVVICIDGSMECFDATSSGLESRWIVSNCHSHITHDLSIPPSADRSKAASASGPVRSFAFSPTSYELLLVDAQMGSLAIYNATNSQPTNELLTTQNTANVLSASWSTSSGDLLALGKEDGSIEICRYQQNSLEMLQKLECPNQEEEEGFCCTHLDWSNEYLLVGLCRVEASDEEPDEDDEDDTAEHEAAMYMTSMDMASFTPGEWYELGDVVPFFSVPRGGRHAFFSSFVHSAKHPLCVVASNVGTDVAVLAEEDGSWAVVEFEEGNETTTPTDDEDEFSYPIGVGVVPLASGFFQLLLPTTDGSLSTFTFQKEDDPEGVKVVTPLSTDLDDAAVEMIESSSSPPELTEEPPVPEPAEQAVEEAAPPPASSGFSFGGGGGGSSADGSSAFSFGSNSNNNNNNNNATTESGGPVFGSGSSSGVSFGSGYSSSFSFAPAKIPSSSIASSSTTSNDDKPLFGSSSTPSKPSFGSAFGQPSTLGGGGGGFGQPSTLGGNSGSSLFGQTSSLGASAFGSPAAKTPQATAAPIFGGATSTPSSGPVFGSATKAGITGGFAALSTTPPAAGGFGATFSASSQKKPSYSEPSVFESMQKKAETESSTTTPQADAPPVAQTPPAKTSSNAPVFGSGSRAPSFTFGAPSSASPFTVNTATPSAAAESPFNAFGSSPSKTSPSQGGFMAKPLFGTKKEEEEKVVEPEQPSTPQASPLAFTTNDLVSAAGEKAARVFDTLDEETTGYLPIDSFESLSEELGEGFHGDEYDKQIALIDPAGSGFISRATFIDWYTTLVEGDDDEGYSLDTEERAEQEEERLKALEAFQSISGGKDTIPETDFPKLIESLNTVYCEEEHQKTLKKIAWGGEIDQLAFLSWYVDWLFGGDESSIEEEDEGKEASDEAKEASTKAESLSAVFSVDKDSWKCEICSVRNKSDLKKCVACETVRPGFEDEVAKENKEAAAGSGSGIGSGGFSFGAPSSSGGIGSSGFSFGAPAPAAESSTTASSSGGGFTFGAPSAGFTFGAPKTETSKPVTESGFTFGGPAARVAATTPKSSEAGTGFSFTPSKATTNTEPPAPADQTLSAAGKSAARVFDTIDEEKTGSLRIDSFENLSEELGEGFHGDEYDKQIAIIDPSGSGEITRAAFINWYTGLVEGEDDDGSIDSEERAEREEERRKAEEAFQNLSADKSPIPSSDFPKLIESLNTVYCEDEHRRTLKKISKDGTISEKDFLNWYVDWLFGGDESSDDEDYDDDDDDKEASAAAKAESSAGGSLTAVFAVDKDSWKCEICSVRNKGDVKKCAACETVRPGFEDEVAKEENKAAAVSGSGIGSGGFSFGAPSSGGIGSSGFSFGSPAPAVGESNTPSSGGGFTFGTPVPAAAESNTASIGGGFSFGAPAPASAGFTFGAPTTDTTSPEKASSATKSTTPDPPLSAAGKSAARVFDTIDEEKTGSLRIDSFENLSEELGEGFHGDEYDKQIAIIDPSGSGEITRAAFINWYTGLVEGEDDDGSIDSEERAEREEERRKAEEAFQNLSADKSPIPSSDFPKLIESLNTVYCEDEHRRTLKKISKDGTISEKDFLNWYVDWLFGGDESSDDEDYDDDDDSKEASAAAKAESSAGGSLTAVFAVDKDSWKCEICSVRNKGDVKKCAACETVRPGFEDEVAKEENKAAALSGSGIGSGGFSFGGSSPSGGIGSSGFSFGSPAPAAGEPNTTSSGGGFTFGAPAPAPASTGFTFGSTQTASTGASPSGATGFTFGATPSAGEPKASAGKTGESSTQANMPASSGGYPPISSKAPTPFSSKTSPASGTTESSGGYPPISSKAPTPFGSKGTPAVGTKDASTPTKPANPFSGISLVPSKPSGSAVMKATNTTSSAAFPPMSAKAPTPFSATKTSASGSKDAKPPNPFAGISLVPASTSVTSSKATTTPGSAAFPPMSTKAPTPFSAKTTSASVASTKAATSAGSAAFPPMSSKAPTPFGASTTSGTSQSPFSVAPKATPSIFGSSSTKAATSAGSAAFPPMSSKAPTPFGASTTSSTSQSPFSVAPKAPATASVASKKATTTSSSAAFPPMSSKAPTPFSAKTPSTSVTSTKATTSGSSAAFPPMSAKAPTPFSAKTPSTIVTSTKAATSGSSAAFPPMSAKAPTPFSANTTSASVVSTKAATSAGSATFPPMSSKAPTPFGSGTSTGTSQTPFSIAPKASPSMFGSSSTKSSTSASTPAFPPMSSKAPTPFGGGQAKESTSGYPPVSSKAPTPFGGSQSSTKTQKSVTGKTTTAIAVKQSSQQAARASSSSGPHDRLGVSSLRSKLPRNMPAAGMKLLELTEKMERVLDRVGELHANVEMDGDFEEKVQSMVDRVQNHRVSLTGIGTSVGRQRQINTFLLSRKVDSERQIKEASRLVDIMVTESAGEREKLAETQPLDYESEMNRRKFAASSIGIVGKMKLADERLQLFEAAAQSHEHGSLLLAQGIVNQYKWAKNFKHKVARIEGKLDKASQSLPLQEKQRIKKSREGQSTYGLTTTPRKQRLRPVPLAGALTPLSKLASNRDQNASSARKWNNITSSLQSVGKKYSCTLRLGGTSRLKNLRRSEEEKPAFKSPSVARSLLLSPSQEKPYAALPQSSNVSSSTSITIFSPKTKPKARAAWDTVSTLDQMKARELSFSVPSKLKEATLTDASRSKLERFGTTPEKVRKSMDIKKSQSAAPTPTAKPKAPSAKKEVASAAFPPMSSKAPSNPFSKTAQKTTDSKRPVKPKQDSSYPPMSAVAPKKPFSSNETGSKSTSVPKSETAPPPKTTDKSATKSDPFSTASMGSSLFSSGGSGSAPSPFGAKPSSESSSKNSGPPDYNAILVAFYQKHNPAKLSEVGKTLEKFKGREVELFQKLGTKYKVKSPLDESQNAPSTLSGFANAAPAKSPFSSAGAPASTAAASPFQSSGPSNTLSSASPFSSGATMNTGSTFGKPPASPFGPAPGTSTMGSSAPFGSPAPSSTPFGSGGLTSSSPFGAAPSPSPFGSSAAPAPTMQIGGTQNSLQGKDPRQMLMQFYQRYNPNKLGEVDKVLTKYKGKEEQLFRNLAKKYNLDASAFGLPPAPAAGGFGSPAPAPTGFGQASALGGAPAFGGSSGFGQTTQMGFGSTNTAGSGMTFGSGMSSAQGTSSFGSLAQTPSPSPFGASSMGGGFGSPAPAFGAAPSMGFGGSTPFGAPRR